MLVKLGEVWVDPAKVEALDGEFVVTASRSLDSRCSDIDSMAAIVNESLVVQSFGGEIPDVPEKV